MTVECKKRGDNEEKFFDRFLFISTVLFHERNSFSFLLVQYFTHKYVEDWLTDLLLFYEWFVDRLALR
jgi:hypothetical protein